MIFSEGRYDESCMGQLEYLTYNSLAKANTSKAYGYCTVDSYHRGSQIRTRATSRYSVRKRVEQISDSRYIRSFQSLQDLVDNFSSQVSDVSSTDSPVGSIHLEYLLRNQYIRVKTIDSIFPHFVL